MPNAAELEKKDVEAALDRLALCANEHAVFRNPFYRLWTKRCLDAQAFEIFRVNYALRVGATVGRMSRALVTIDDPDVRIKLWENIGDELGHGDSERVHIRLFEYWAANLALRLQPDPFTINSNKAVVLDSTYRFIEHTNEMCQRDHLSAAGAILAQEWHGYSQIACLYDGYLNYRKLFEGEEFHDIAEYFYVHIGRAERQHKIQAIEIAKALCKDAADFESIKNAFEFYLDLLNEFWISIYREISSQNEEFRI